MSTRLENGRELKISMPNDQHIVDLGVAFQGIFNASWMHVLAVVKTDEVIFSAGSCPIVRLCWMLFEQVTGREPIEVRKCLEYALDIAQMGLSHKY